MTRRKKILDLLIAAGIPVSCGTLSQCILSSERLTGNKAAYLSGSISSLLVKMVKAGEIEVAKKKGPRGGKTYIIKE